MAFFDPALFLRLEFAEYSIQMLAQFLVSLLPPAFWNKDRVVLAVPS